MERYIPILPHRLRRRFWKAAGLIALFIVTLAMANPLSPPQRSVTGDMLGHDFLPFYAAGTFARSGRFADFYDLSAIKRCESAIGHSVGWKLGFGPWWNPPFAAWLFVPFTFLPFAGALVVWELLGLLAAAAAAYFLSRAIPGAWANRVLVPALILISGPFIAVAAHGQNTFLTLLIVSIVVMLWRNGQDFASGLVAGLLLYKPQHAAVLAAALILSRGWRAAAGLALTAIGLIVITLITMPGALPDYLHKLPQMIAVMQVQSDYSWDRHVTLKAFWRLLFQGTDAGTMNWMPWLCWWASEAIVLRILWEIFQAARRDPTQTDRLIAASIVATPLLAPFFFDYDLLILAPAAVLCAADSLRNGLDRRLLLAWTAIYFLTYISNPIAHLTGFNPAAPALIALLAAIAHSPRRAAVLAMQQPIESQETRAMAA